MWSAGIKDGPGGIKNNQFTYKGYFRKNLPQGPGKMLFTGCQQFGEYVLTDIFTRKNGILETEQEPIWHCTELVCSTGSTEMPPA